MGRGRPDRHRLHLLQQPDRPAEPAQAARRPVYRDPARGPADDAADRPARDGPGEGQHHLLHARHVIPSRQQRRNGAGTGPALRAARACLGHDAQRAKVAEVLPGRCR
ncbi:hypothetical protein [Ornithinimicrobium kibberense]|uniref:hypothetical protein n=1 Tax=Ornithinimicrobium kibberense TaxID=282060 RepID=UPI00360A55D7